MRILLDTQANFHFLLRVPRRGTEEADAESRNLQEAFFDPDVLVDWDTVDTVCLSRKVPRDLARHIAPSCAAPEAGMETSIERLSIDEVGTVGHCFRVHVSL